MSFILMPFSSTLIKEDKTSKFKSMDESTGAMQDRIADLESKVDRLTLISQALWEMLRSRYELSDEDLEALVTEIDLRDGKLDGRMTQKPESCNRCGRTVSIRTGMCLYCGYKARD